MENGSLFNSGFLGASFNWWVGRIEDDSTWRDNILPGKSEDVNKIPGWGYRYKVRIIGLHDQGENEISSDQLPWSQVMYPVTAGGGQVAAFQTPNLRQGNMVFGFFLDGQEQQVPVIMGVLGNNVQTPLGNTFGTVTNTTPGSLAISGLAQGKNPPPGTALPKIPDNNLATNSSKGPTIEGVNAVHLLSNADVKRKELYAEKIVMLEPNNLISSSVKAIQTELENLTKLIDKIAHSVGSYIDIISSVSAIASCEAAAARFGKIISKYMKIIFYNIFSYMLKKINKALSPTVGLLFPNLRWLYLDIKELITELINCLFKKLVDGLSDAIAKALIGKILCGQPSQSTQAPFVPICTAENLVGDLLSNSKGEVQGELDKVLGVANSFLGDISKQLDTVGALSEQVLNISNIASSLVSSLDFNNIILKFFGCDSSPNSAISEYYTIESGGNGVAESLLPNFSTIAKAFDSTINIAKEIPIPFASPTRTNSINYSDRRSSPEEISTRTIA